VLTQYKSHSLDRHVTKTWRMSTMLGNYVAPVPAQQRRARTGTSAAPTRSTSRSTLIDDERPDIVVVVGADHVYRMDFSQMVDQHIETGAGVTVARSASRSRLADQFGVIEVDPPDPRSRSALPREADRRGAARQPRTRCSPRWATTSSTPTSSSTP
jgi:glucose-1-phosphate adenylyltransferase